MGMHGLVETFKESQPEVTVAEHIAMKDVEQSVGNDAPHDEHDTALNKNDPKPAVENSEMVPGAKEWQDALNDIEEGGLESSSSDEDDEPESFEPPQKEIKTIPQNADKAKTSFRNKAGTNPQVQNDKKKSAKPTKNKNASNRRH
ncbi:unnamed protein product [Brassica oleracea var. botrytis]